MADISKITLPDNSQYNIKDTTARDGLATKQDTLVSGTNIKTINNESLLGSGNITIQGGGDSLPDQTGHSGDILTTNGTAASWMDVSEASSVSIDTAVTEDSDNLVTSGAVYNALSNIDALPDQTGNSGKYLTTNGSVASWANTPTEIPSQSGNNGKYLTTNGSSVSWGSINIPSPADATPLMDSTAAVGTSTDYAREDHVHPTDTSRASSTHTHGNITNSGDITATAPTIANGDQIVINDDSASKITNGPIFDGSTTNKYLSPKGTWESIPDISGKIDTAGTGLSKSGTTLNHSNSVTAQTTSAVYPIKIDAQGHISEYGSAVTIPSVASTSSILKGNGSGGAVAATAGTDYQAPLVAGVDYVAVKSYDPEYGANMAPFTVITNSYNTGIKLETTGEHYWNTINVGIGNSIILKSESETSDTNTITITPTTTTIGNIVTPTANGDAANKKYVDDAVAGVDALPSQTGNSGKYLTTNGSAASWATVETLPPQTGNSGKYLTTNGTSASWGATSATSTKSIDTAPTSSSSNLVTSGGVYTAINNKVNRTTAVNVADTNYTTLMARGMVMLSASTYDTVTNWSTYLVNGSIAWRYE